MTVTEVAKSIIKRYEEVPAKHSMLVGISGIDASGKGHVTARLSEELSTQRFRTALINIDGWLNLPHVRFDNRDLPGNFYRNAIRFDELFEQLIIPLRAARSVFVTTDFTEETATGYSKHTYALEDVDIILLEGIFLFKKDLVSNFDLKIWIECSFVTALRRAVGRSQEGLNADETIKAYESIYFPAQELHFALDAPRAAADIMFDNE